MVNMAGTVPVPPGRGSTTEELDLAESVAGEEDPGASIDIPATPQRKPCPACGGSGKQAAGACPVCQGTGMVAAGSDGV